MIRMCFLLILPFCISNQKYSKLNEKPKPLSDAQRWALGASGMLASRNHMKFDSLAGCEINIFTIKEWKDVLKDWWSIDNRESLLENLEWLQNEGHSAKFETFKEIITTIKTVPGPTVVRAEYEEAIKNNEEFKDKIAVVARYNEFLGDKSLYGWDAARYICLCRWGFICGYLTEDEAWEKIMSATRFIQKTFDSWEDLGTNYLIGREFWSPKNEDRYIFEDTYMRLLEMPGSPWKQLPWDLPLGEEDEDKGGGRISTGVIAMNSDHRQRESE
jgi:hypothetical protein